MYKNSLQYIKEHITKNYVLHHKKYYALIVKEYYASDDDLIIIAHNPINQDSIKHFSLNYLYENALIKDENLFEQDNTIPIEEIQQNDENIGIVENPKTPIQSSKDSNRRNNVISYSKLFKMMEDSDPTTSKFSRWFWHYTHVKNLIQIINCGKFLARHNIEGNIPFDIKQHNETSLAVQETNSSWRIQRHVRFYLRPLNASFFSAKASLDKDENMVVVSISRNALFDSQNSTFLYPKNAHYATDQYLEKENELNHKYENSFYVKNLENFRFEETYCKHSPNQSLERKSYQHAEFLVWRDLPISYIEKIYFKSSAIMSMFLNSIKNQICYNEIATKCVVNTNLFYAGGYI